ncbi:MAG: hypothetical protein ACOY4D_03440 [Pseudomonadota bacterium]
MPLLRPELDIECERRLRGESVLAQGVARAVLWCPVVEVFDGIEQFLACNNAITCKGGQAALELAQAVIGGECQHDGFVFLADDLHARNGIEGGHALVAHAQPNLEQLAVIESADVLCHRALPRLAKPSG